MQRSVRNGLILTLILAAAAKGIPVYAQMSPPTLMPASGCIGYDGTPQATCSPPACLGIDFGVVCVGILLPTSCDFRTGVFFASCVPAYIAFLIQILFSLTGAIFLLMIILAGYQYVIGKASGGGGEEGKARLRFAIIGFLVTALSFYIVDFVLSSL